MGRPGYQGKSGNARNSWQRAPNRSPPKGADALTELERLFAPEESVAVVAIRDDGRRVLYGHYDDRAAAEAVVAALKRIHLRAEIVAGVERSTQPGTSIPPTR